MTNAVNDGNSDLLFQKEVFLFFLKLGTLYQIHRHLTAS